MGFARASIIIISAAILAMGAAAAKAHPRHRHSTVVRPIARETASDPREMPNGVPGNAPFNNQLRKFSDPLGANGSK